MALSSSCSDYRSVEKTTNKHHLSSRIKGSVSVENGFKANQKTVIKRKENIE